MTSVQFAGMVVTSEHPRSTEPAALCVAKVLAKNWLAGAPQDEPLTVTFKHSDGAEVPYTATAWMGN